MMNTHLSDDRLIELGLNDSPSSGEQLHLGECSACENRRAATARMLEELSIAAHEDADAVFTAERLARQQTRIQQRIEQESRVARVIAFPAGHDAAPVPAQPTHRASRWIAAAAVAGLLVGVAAGRLAPETRRALGGRPGTVAVQSLPSQTVRATTATLSDDQLLGEIELAVDRRGGQSLRPLDELTPRAWDIGR